MMQTQNSTGIPQLDAVIATAKMTTPDGGDTVAAQVAQAAQQKLSPSTTSPGVGALLPGVRQQAVNAAQAAQPVTQAQVQQMMQQAMRPQPVGIEQVPAQNMQDMQKMAGGGVVGYAGPTGSFVSNLSMEEIERMTPDMRKAYFKELLERRNAPMPTPTAPPAPPAASMRPGLGIASAMAKKLGPLALLSDLFTTSDEDVALLQKAEAERNAVPTPADARPRGQESYGPTPPVVAPDVAEAMRSGYAKFPGSEIRSGTAVSNAAPRPPVPRPPAAPAAPAAPQGGIAALPARPTYDTASVAAAGAPYITTGEGDVGKLRAAEGKRAEFEKTLPDLSAKGIAALEASEQERQRLLGTQRGDDKFNRQMALLRGFQGDRNAYDRVVAGQQARDDLARQAQLSFEQARVKEMQAQQERQLGRFDRAIALEKEAAALMEKARDNALKAQQIAQGIASAQYEGAVKVRGQDIGVEEGARERASREKIAREGIAGRAAGAGERGAITQRDLAKYRFDAEKQVEKLLPEDREYRKLRNDPTAQAAYKENLVRAKVREATLAAGLEPPAGYEKPTPAPPANDPFGIRKP